MAPPPPPPPPVVSPLSGWVRIIDILAQDSSTIYNKVWQDAGQTILQSATATTPNLFVSVEASYPLVLLNGTQYTLAKTAGYYAGALPITVNLQGETIEAQVVTGDDEDGAIDTTVVTVEAPPVLTSLRFTGGYPGTQTELKAGDTFQVTGTTDVPIGAVEILDFGALVGSVETAVLGTTFTVTGTVADRGTTVQHLPARVRVANLGGAYGPTRDTNLLGGTVDGVDLVAVNNRYPTVTWGAPTYPGAQGALKASESATVGLTTDEASSAVFDSPTGELSIINPTVLEPVKTVQRIAGTYNVSTPNLRATVTRGANGAQAVGTTVVGIADTPASVTVTVPAARLQSGGYDGTTAPVHPITVTSTQQLLGAPSLTAAPTAGTFVGSWTGGPTVWQRGLQVTDAHPKGTYAWQAVSATNLAGLTTTVITGDDQYVLGGFVARSVTFAPFATTAQMVVPVGDFGKLTAGIFTATNQIATKQPIGTSPPVTNGYTIDATGVSPTEIQWLDTTAATTNATGTAQLLDIEEVP